MFGLGHLIADFFRPMVRWYFRVRIPPYRDVCSIDPWTSTDHGEHNVQGISRHSIAESGLICPVCNNEVAARGVFRHIFRTRIGSTPCEALECGGIRQNGVRCGTVLFACPDTEHGDDQMDYDTKKFHRFKRIDEKQAMREQYGEDIIGENPSQLSVKMSDLIESKPEPEGIKWDDVADKSDVPKGEE